MCISRGKTSFFNKRHLPLGQVDKEEILPNSSFERLTGMQKQFHIKASQSECCSVVLQSTWTYFRYHIHVVLRVKLWCFIAMEWSGTWWELIQCQYVWIHRFLSKLKLYNVLCQNQHKLLGVQDVKLKNSLVFGRKKKG